MNERQSIDHELSALEGALKALEMRFEQYQAGVERRAPMLERDRLAQRLRRFAARRITQTDLRFRYQNLATRFHTYAAHWDRILRQVEEGRRVRPVVAQGTTATKLPSSTASPRTSFSEQVDSVYRQLVAASAGAGAAPGTVPDRDQLRALLEKKRAQIVEKFGDRDVEFVVELDEARPRIKVRAKR